MKTVIVTGGRIDLEFGRAFLEGYEWDRLIAADGGLTFLYEAGLTPSCILGDFDSVDRRILEYYRTEKQVPIRTYNPKKDAADTEIALRTAIEEGASEICILGATGSRIDHVLANIQILNIALRFNIPCSLLDEHNKIWLTDRSVAISRQGQYGNYISLFPIGGPVKGLTLEGFLYPLRDHELTCDSSLSVSNEIVGEWGSISFAKGTLAVIEARD